MMLRAFLWPTLLGPTPTTGRPMVVSCHKALPDLDDNVYSDDQLSLDGMSTMLGEMLSCYVTTGGGWRCQTRTARHKA